MSAPLIRIGTRSSPLAIWQARLVETALNRQGYATEIISIKTEGDADLFTPIYEMGVQGVFTKAADVALLNRQIDIAVHSLKDVPTLMAAGLKLAAVLERDSPLDVLVFNGSADFLQNPYSEAVVATGSIRRKAQWLHRYPLHRIENLRGNVNTRLAKLGTYAWNGAVFAAAGLERLGLKPENSVPLDWMCPAPAQGAVAAVCRETDLTALEVCRPLNHAPTALCAHIERDFLRSLHGGCSAPVGAYASVSGQNILFRGNVCSLDGVEKIEIQRIRPAASAYSMGSAAAGELLEKGADRLLADVRASAMTNDE